MQNRRDLKATELTRMERRQATVPMPAHPSIKLDLNSPLRREKTAL